MNQPQKRRNPFDNPIRQNEQIEEKKEVEQEIEAQQPIKQEEIVEEVEEQPVVEPIRVETRQVRPTVRAKQTVIDDESREKYTSTMEVTLRRRIKIVCATRGIMFSEFIEDACREKLRREGER